MSQFIKLIGGQTRVEFDLGSFDEWCVYLQQGKFRYAPEDVEYFSALKSKSQDYGGKLIYDDFVSIYLSTSKVVDHKVLKHITRISKKYGNDAHEMDKWFTVLYARMIAEENKSNAVLKKRVKRLGIHQLLLEDYEPVIAASFSKTRNLRQLDLLMRQRGF